jgi:hypothetical protein
MAQEVVAFVKGLIVIPSLVVTSKERRKKRIHVRQVKKT